MPTDCNPGRFDFGRVEGRRVVAAFDGGRVTSDAGALLLGATDKAIGLVERLAGCFRDGRRAELVEHSLPTLIGQRVFAIALGYEDLVGHDELRFDPVLAALAGKLAARRRDCAPLAGKSTLNRLEHAPSGVATRYHRIGHDGAAIERLFVDLFLKAHATPPREIVLDLDATDDPLHGHQEGRFFHGYYDCYCYLPLYVFCGRHLLAAKLRRSNIDASARCHPGTRPHRRAHSRGVAAGADRAARRFRLRTQPAAGKAHRGRSRRNPPDQPGERPAGPGIPRLPVVDEGQLSRRRRVIGKAEWTRGEANPRFVVTSLKPDRWPARSLYEELYCARGEMENRIKECQLDLGACPRAGRRPDPWAGRTSAATMRANQLIPASIITD